MASVHVIERSDFQALMDALTRRGYKIIRPTVRDQAIVYDEIRSVGDLPVGWTDRQDGGSYRLRDDEALFGYAVGPHSWKQYHLPPRGHAMGILDRVLLGGSHPGRDRLPQVHHRPRLNRMCVGCWSLA